MLLHGSTPADLLLFLRQQREYRHLRFACLDPNFIFLLFPVQFDSARFSPLSGLIPPYPSCLSPKNWHLPLLACRLPPAGEDAKTARGRGKMPRGAAPPAGERHSTGRETIPLAREMEDFPGGDGRSLTTESDPGGVGPSARVTPLRGKKEEVRPSS